MTTTLFLAVAFARAGIAGEATVDPDGTVHVSAFLLPESSLLDDGSRAVLKRERETLEKDWEAAFRECPFQDSTPAGAGAQKFRDCQVEAMERTALYKAFLERYRVRITSQRIGGVETEVFTPEAGVPPKNQARVLIDLHGGHFKNGSRTISRTEAIPIASVGQFEVVSVDYRMAPEHAFPAASEDAAAVYKELLKTHKPGNIGIYGCSAGGLLTAQTVAWLEKEGLPLPGAVGMFGSGAAYYQDGDSAQFAEAKGLTREPVSEHPYFKTTTASDPLAFPIRSAQLLRRFPPSLLLSASRDLALSSVLITHSTLVNLGVDAELHVWEGMDHCFFFGSDVPQSDEAHKLIARFFDRHLGSQ